MTEDERMLRNIVTALLQSHESFWSELRAERFEITPSAASAFHQCLISRISSIMESSVYFLFLEYLNEEDMLDLYLENDAASELQEYREKYEARLIDQENAYLRERLPGLIGKVQETAAAYQNTVKTLISRLDACDQEIRDHLLNGKSFQKLLDITEPGDVHNYGQKTSILVLDQGRIVYKPHDVSADRMGYELFERFFRDVMRAPRIVEKENYGFAEYIEPRAAKEEEEARKYFYHLGGFSAVVQMLGSTDLHHSNVLAQGEYPVIIDYELLMTASIRNPGTGLAYELASSLLYSSLMPSRRGAIEMSILFAHDEENPCAPTVNGVRKDVRDYPEEFLQGFREIYERILNHKEELKAFISEWTNVKLRHLYRNTQEYTDLMKKTLEPGWVENPGLRDQLMKELSVAMKRSGDHNADLITIAETEGIMRGDVPYLYTISGSTDLYADGKAVYPDFFWCSAIDHVISRIEYMKEADLLFEAELLKKAMTRVIFRTGKPYVPGGKITERRVLSEAELLCEAERIFCLIRDDAIRTPGGKLCWFGPDYFLKTGMSVLSSTMMDGTTGLALFFAAIFRFSKNPVIQKDAKALIDYLYEGENTYIEDLLTMRVIYPNITDLSLTHGLAGKLLAWHLTGFYLKEDRFSTFCEKIIKAAGKVDLQYENADPYGGIAGMLNVLCRYDALFAKEGAREFAEQLAIRIKAAAQIPYRGKMLWKTLSRSWPISGAGHGQSGVASALYLAGRRLNRPDLIQAAMQGFEFESEVYCEKTGAWPDRRIGEHTEEYMTGYCSGAPGIGLNAIRIKYAGYETNAERAIFSCLKEPLQYKDFLCCGNSAVIEFLLEASIVRNDPSLKEEAVTRMALMMARAKQKGYYNCTGKTVNDVFSSSLFYGAAGIGYECLRLAYPKETESVLI